jgi:hypothetical protein
MSVVIDNTEDLLALLKKLNVKVTSVDEVRQLLTTVNANYNPDATRQRTGKLVGMGVPGIMAGAGAAVSFFLLLPGHPLTPYHVGVLALVWGAVALVSTAAVLASAIMTSLRRGSTRVNVPPPEPSPLHAALTGITNELRS